MADAVVQKVSLVYQPLTINVNDVVRGGPTVGFKDRFTEYYAGEWTLGKIARVVSSIFVVGLVVTAVQTCVHKYYHKTSQMQHDLDKVVSRVARANFKERDQDPKVLAQRAELYGTAAARGVASGGLIPKLINDAWAGIQAKVEEHVESQVSDLQDAAKEHLKKQLLQTYLLNLPLDGIFEQLWAKVTASIEDNVGVDNFQNKYNKIRLLHDLKAGLEERFQNQVISLIDTAVSEAPGVISAANAPVVNVEQEEDEQEPLNDQQILQPNQVNAEGHAKKYVQWMFDQSARLGAKFMEHLNRIYSGEEQQLQNPNAVQHEEVDEAVDGFENEHGSEDAFVQNTGIKIRSALQYDKEFDKITESFRTSGIRERIADRLKKYQERHLTDSEQNQNAHRDQLTGLKAYHADLHEKLEAANVDSISALPEYLTDDLTEKTAQEDALVEELSQIADEARQEALKKVKELRAYFTAPQPNLGLDPALQLICGAPVGNNGGRREPLEENSPNPFEGYHQEAAEFITAQRKTYAEVPPPMQPQNRDAAKAAIRSALQQAQIEFPVNDDFNINEFCGWLLSARDDGAFGRVIDRLDQDIRAAVAQAANGAKFNENENNQEVTLEQYRQSQTAQPLARKVFLEALRAEDHQGWAEALDATAAQLASLENLPDELGDLAIPGEVYAEEENVGSILQAMRVEQNPPPLKTKISAYRKARELANVPKAAWLEKRKVENSRLHNVLDPMDLDHIDLPQALKKKRDAFDELITFVEGSEEEDPFLHYRASVKPRSS